MSFSRSPSVAELTLPGGPGAWLGLAPCPFLLFLDLGTSAEGEAEGAGDDEVSGARSLLSLVKGLSRDDDDEMLRPRFLLGLRIKFSSNCRPLVSLLLCARRTALSGASFAASARDFCPGLSCTLNSARLLRMPLPPCSLLEL